MMTGTPGSSNNANARRPAPDATFGQVDALAALVQQLGSLLDGSLKRVALAHRTLAKSGLALANATAAEAEQHLSKAAADLERMAEMVHAAMQGRAQPLGSPNLSKARPVTLGEAIEHASTVIAPLAKDQHANVKVEIEPGVESLSAGSLYTVVLNALQNAVESVGRCGGGNVTVTLKRGGPPDNTFGRDSRRWLLLEIGDDGAGPPPMPERSRVFDLGYTTKPNGSGLGLAVARSVVRAVNGTIELVPASGAASPSRKGAVLRVQFPAAAGSEQVRLGGAA